MKKYILLFLFAAIGLQADESTFEYRLEVELHPAYANDAALNNILAYARNARVSGIAIESAVNPIPERDSAALIVLRNGIGTLCRHFNISIPVVPRETKNRVTVSGDREGAPLQLVQTPFRMAMARGTDPWAVVDGRNAGGRFLKSFASERRALCEVAALGGRRAILHHADQFQSGTSLSPYESDALAKLTPYLNYYATCGVTEATKTGVNVYISPYDNDAPWNKVLTILGISTKVVTEVDPTRLTAIGERTAKSLPDTEIRLLLKGKLLLDASAAMVLVQRGFGKDIGIDSARWIGLEESGYAYEQIRDPNPAPYGIKQPRMTAQRLDGPVLAIETKSEICSDIHRFSREPMFPGLIRYTNDQGGSGLVMAYGIGRGQFYMGYFNRFRKLFMQKEIMGIDPDNTIALAPGNLPLHIHCDNTEHGIIVTIVNPTMETLESVAFRLPDIPEPSHVWLITPDVPSPTPVELESVYGNLYLKRVLPSLSQITLKIERP